MKLLCERDELFEAINAASRALSVRGSNGVRLTLKENQLVSSGRGADLMIEVETTVSGMEDGSVVVPAGLLADLVKSMPEGAVEFTTDENSALLRAGRSELSLQLLADLDPPFIKSPSVDEVVVKDSELREALRSVIRASSKDDTRDVMYTGVLFSSTETGLRMVSTDGIRLALRDVQGIDVLGEESGEEVIVPARALAELDRMTQSSKDRHDELSVRIGSREAVFEFGGYHLTTRLIDGKFRDYKQLLQPSYPRVLLVDKQRVVDGLRRLRRLAKEAREMTHLRLDVSSSSLEMSVRIPQVGQAKESLDATFSGDDFVVAFDPELFADGIDAVSTDIVRIEFTENNRPACISNSDTRDFQYLVMPIRFK